VLQWRGRAALQGNATAKTNAGVSESPTVVHKMNRETTTPRVVGVGGGQGLLVLLLFAAGQRDGTDHPTSTSGIQAPFNIAASPQVWHFITYSTSTRNRRRRRLVTTKIYNQHKWQGEARRRSRAARGHDLVVPLSYGEKEVSRGGGGTTLHEKGRVELGEKSAPPMACRKRNAKAITAVSASV